MSTQVATVLPEPIELVAVPSRTPTLGSSATASRRDDPDDTASTLRRLGLAGEAEDDGLPPQDRGRKAWQFVAASFVLETFIWGFGYSFSSVLVWFQAHEPWSQYSLASLSAIGTIQFGVQYLLPIVVVNGFRRYPEYAKTALLVAAVAWSLAMVASSFATQVWQLILLQGVVCGTAGAVMYAPVLSQLNDWFVTRRGLASGIIYSGTGLGGFAFPFLISKLLDEYGFAGMCRVWAALFGVSTIASILVLEPRRPPVRPVGKREPWFQLDFSVVRNPLFSFIGATVFVASLASFPVSLYLATFAASALHSSSLFLPSVVVAAFNASAFVGSSLIGYAADRSLPWTISLLGIGGALVALCAWGFSNSLASIMAFAILYGFGSRISTYLGPVAREIAGTNLHASTTLLCLFGIIRGTASVAGPFISTALYEEQFADSDHGTWGRYGFRKIIIFVGVMSFVSAFGGLAVRQHKRKTERAARD